MADFPHADAALPLYTTAYLAETRRLTAEERGCYHLILCHAWIDPNFSIDNKKHIKDAIGINQKKWSKIRPSIDDLLSPYLGA